VGLVVACGALAGESRSALDCPKYTASAVASRRIGRCNAQKERRRRRSGRLDRRQSRGIGRLRGAKRPGSAPSASRLMTMGSSPAHTAQTPTPSSHDRRIPKSDRHHHESGTDFCVAKCDQRNHQPKLGEDPPRDPQGQLNVLVS